MHVSVIARNFVIFNQVSKIFLGCSTSLNSRCTAVICLERTVSSKASSSQMAHLRWRTHIWNVDVNNLNYSFIKQ